MADEAVSQLAQYTTYANVDLLTIVDVDDATFASSGTNKQSTNMNWLNLAANGDVTVNASTGVWTVGKIGGTTVANSATIDATNATNITSGTLPVARLPVTGLTITQHKAPITVDTISSGAWTLDMSVADWHQAQFAAATTLTFSNVVAGQDFTAIVQQSGSGNYAITWPSGITWVGSPYTAPTMPATASAYLVAHFKALTTSTYLGWWLGNSAS